MTSVIESRVTDFQTLRASCLEQRRLHEDPIPFVREAVRRCMAHLRNNDSPSAIDVATVALRKLPNHPDLLCMLGRCKFSGNTTLPSEAIELFKAALENGCRRSELFENWISALRATADWPGVIKVSHIGETRLNLPGRFSVDRAEAFMQQADSLVRANRYGEAERLYLEGTQDIKQSVINGMLGIFRNDARASQQILIRRWLGVVSAQCKNNSDYSRLLGALLKAEREYGWLDLATAERVSAMAKQYITSVSKRPSISQSMTEVIQRDLFRLHSLINIVKQKILNADIIESLEETHKMGTQVIFNSGLK